MRCNGPLHYDVTMCKCNVMIIKSIRMSHKETVITKFDDYVPHQSAEDKQQDCESQREEPP